MTDDRGGACPHDAESGTSDPDVWRCDGCGVQTRQSSDDSGLLTREPVRGNNLMAQHS